MVLYLTKEERKARRQFPYKNHTESIGDGEPIVVVSPTDEVDSPTEQIDLKPAVEEVKEDKPEAKRKTKKEKETKEDEV